MHKQIRLINPIFIPHNLRNKSAADKYDWLREYYTNHKFVLLNNISVFGPYPRPEVSWDISEAEKLAIYHPEVTKVLTWVKTKIIINLGYMDYKTLDVLIRIATGMLNKCNIPKSVKIMFHDNMVQNLRTEHQEIILSNLPF